ncbi:MAG: hypothetical protein GX896_02820 [Clostridiales bacterium]|nr:hypothetical protein [Clostridiales bacterium]
MTVLDAIEKSGFKVLNLSDDAEEREISGVYCCDLLSVVMSKCFENAAWVTIMANVNSVAVATLTEMSCIILADGAAIDEIMITKAKQQGITVVQSDKPIFETALKINQLVNANA